MIHRIEIENYRSIREKQVIDLTLPATTPEMDRFVASHGSAKVRLPKVIAFFGSNASGKSTVLRAVANVMDFIIHSFSLPPDNSIWYFHPFLSHEYLQKPTRIIIEFDAEWKNNIAYVYRYSVTIDNRKERIAGRVLEESLSIRDGKRFRYLFKRNEQVIRCAPDLDLPPSDSRLKAVKENSSLISTMAQLNHPMLRLAWQDVALAQRNIRGLQFTPPDIKDALKFLYEHREYWDSLREQMKRFDLGLQDINIIRDHNGFHGIFMHHGLDSGVLDMEESNGTKRFVAIFPLLWLTLQTGRPSLIDEFDVDLHPMLIPELLGWFHDSDTNPRKAQLFLAAHNASIMDHLEKEEIFLVEKSSDGASTVIPLRSIQGLRREPSLQRKYLGGVFGAVPNIG